MSLPGSHGVACFSAGGATIAVLASADVRSLALDRLGPEASAGSDLRGSCDGVRCWLAGSSFEADLRFLDVAAQLAPELASQAAGRLAVWWLSVDRDRPGDGWSITDEPPTAERVSVLGPFLDRSSARRWGEMLDDLFELCRFPAELRKAPGGTACAYHEMGRCPAACNGSEAMGSYLGRLREALAFDARGIEGRAARLHAQMQEASAGADFERAGALRDRLDALPTPSDRWVSVVGPVGRLDAIAVAPTRRAGRVELLRVNRTGWCRLGDADAGADDAAGVVGALLALPMVEGTLPAIGGVLARELVRPRRGGPELIRWSDASVDRVWSAARRAAKIGSPADSREGNADA